MIYQCGNCSKTTFETTCPTCTPSAAAAGLTAQASVPLIPLDPSFYPEFQYQSKGFIKDFLGKKKEQAQLNDLLNSVLRKYAELKTPYFTNFIHTTSILTSDGDDANRPRPRMNGAYSDRELFREVLLRRGFNELEGHPALLDKLLLTTAFNATYAGFARELTRHMKPTVSESLRSWINEAGTSFRSDLSLFFYFCWENDFRYPDIEYDPQAASTVGVALVPIAAFQKWLQHCEVIYFDIQVERLAARLENFNPSLFVTMYAVDAMDGFQFEEFLVDIFQTIGYDVKGTKKTGDQGADLFVSRFGKDTVIQAKNYSGVVGNSAVQQAIAAKAFYNCDEAMVVTNSYFTKSAKELADSAAVRLVGRVELQKYLDDYNHRIIEQFQVEVVEG